MKTALILLAEGFEEVEALTPVDYLRRAGLNAVTVSVSGSPSVKGARGVTVMADAAWGKMPPDFDCLILPGGMPGSKNLAAKAEVVALIRRAFSEGKIVAAICAAPALVLGKAAGILAGKRFTCSPGMEKDAGSGGTHADERVVTDGSLITSQGAGTAGEFSIAIIKALCGPAKAEEIASSVLLGSPS
jgi:protein deglycase